MRAFVISCPRAIPAVSGSSAAAHIRNGDGPVGDWIARLQSSPARQFRRGSLRVGKRHTQFESVAKYPIVRASLDARLPHPGERRTVLVLAPASLFQF